MFYEFYRYERRILTVTVSAYGAVDARPGPKLEAAPEVSYYGERLHVLGPDAPRRGGIQSLSCPESPRVSAAISDNVGIHRDGTGEVGKRC